VSVAEIAKETKYLYPLDEITNCGRNVWTETRIYAVGSTRSLPAVLQTSLV